jgi:diadenosine tetraphosphate (Ap4A) HIT family hydrolase
MSWTLDLRLAADTLPVADLELCAVRLQDDARWPWLVLVPRRAGLVELEDLPAGDRARLMEEAVRAGDAVRAIGWSAGFEVQKLNVGALGNVVRQLHLHVIGRRPGEDAAGGGPVWGVGVAQRYPRAAAARAIAAARGALGGASLSAPSPSWT